MEFPISASAAFGQQGGLPMVDHPVLTQTVALKVQCCCGALARLTESWFETNPQITFLGSPNVRLWKLALSNYPMILQHLTCPAAKLDLGLDGPETGSDETDDQLGNRQQQADF